MWRHDGVNEYYYGNVNIVRVQHNLLIILTKEFHHFKAGAVITALRCAQLTQPEASPAPLLLSHTHGMTHKLRQIAFTIIRLK